jgi:hypothetical protein
MVTAILAGAAKANPDGDGSAQVDGKLMLEAFQYVTAAMFEAYSGHASAADLELAVEKHSQEILAFTLRMRDRFEETGTHVWNVRGRQPQDA